MSFRRIPFQFSTTDPVQRQAELEKRFGLPGSNMYVDVANPLSKEAASRDLNLAAGSPRLQHRVPIFVEGHDQPVKSSVDSAVYSTDGKKKPNVRIVPIEVEGAEQRPSARHRTFSGPAGWTKGNAEECMSQREDSSPLKRSMHDLSEPSKIRATEGPVIHTIPINFESRPDPVKNTKADKVKPISSKKDQPKFNGCTVSKQLNKVKTPEKEKKTESPIEIALKKINDILEELKTYDCEVQKFTGTIKDKQYRYLDEMLTRCMLRLDDIDTMGNEEVRSARKSAVKKVQASIDLLETKVSAVNEAVADQWTKEGSAEIHTKEVVINAEEKENVRDADMKDLTSETEVKYSQNVVSEVNVSKCEKCKSEDNNIPSNSVSEKTECLQMKEPNEEEMEQLQLDENETDTKPSSEVVEIEMEEKARNVCEEIEMKDETLPSSQNIVQTSGVCEIEMTESKSSESEIQNLDEIPGTKSVEIAETKDESNLVNADTKEKTADVEMVDVQNKPDVCNSKDLSPKPDTSNYLEETEGNNDCQKVNPGIETLESQPDTLVEAYIDSVHKDANGTEVPNVNKNSNL